MSDLLAAGAAALGAALKAGASRAVTYTRRAHTVTLSATQGSSLRTAEGDDGGVRLVVSERDYLITAADLILNGVAAKPERGDKITDGTEVYEVLSPGQGVPEWEYLRGQTVVMRIHTKRVKGG